MFRKSFKNKSSKVGEMMKSGDREQITLRLPIATKEEIDKEAARLGISINAYILLLIDKGRQCLR